MKQAILIIILSNLSLQKAFAQKQVVNKMVIPQKTVVRLLNAGSVSASYKALPSINYKAEAEDFSLLHFNDQPIIRFSRIPIKPIAFFAELSFSDVLENSMNTFKANLVNTYDDYIPELFRDAPSLFKIKCTITL